MDISRVLPGNYHFKRYSLEYFFKECQRLGFHNIELWASGPHFHLEYFSKQNLTDLRKSLSNYNLSVKCLTPEQSVYPISFCHPDEVYRTKSIEFFEKHIEIAPLLDCDMMLISPGISYLDKTEKDQWNWFIEGIQKVANKAEKEGVTLVLEPFTKYSTFIDTSSEVLNMIKEVNSPVLKAVFDTDVVSTTGKETMEEYVKVLGDNIQHVHFVDGNPGGHLVPGKGKLDLNSALESLNEIDYSGYFGLEFFDRDYYFDPGKPLIETMKWFNDK